MEDIITGLEVVGMIAFAYLIVFAVVHYIDKKDENES